jgi:hypothetical protein
MYVCASVLRCQWNRPVHEFLLRHVYLQCLIKYKMARFGALAFTFFVSISYNERFGLVKVEFVKIVLVLFISYRKFTAFFVSIGFHSDYIVFKFFEPKGFDEDVLYFSFSSSFLIQL